MLPFGGQAAAPSSAFQPGKSPPPPHTLPDPAPARAPSLCGLSGCLRNGRRARVGHRALLLLLLALSRRKPAPRSHAAWSCAGRRPRWGLSPEPHPLHPLPAGPAPAPGACTLLAARRPSSLQPFVFLVSRVLAAPARRAETGSRFRFHLTPAETPAVLRGPGGRLLVRATRVHHVTAPCPHGPREAAGSNDGARFVPETSAEAGDPGDRKMNRKHPEPAVETMARLSAGVGLTEGGAGRLRGRARAAGPRAGVFQADWVRS